MNKQQRKNILLEVIHFFSGWLLDNPFLFNYIRYLLAGNQTDMKKFISKCLQKYKCTTVADFCCGTGDFAGVIPQNAEYIGLDLNDDFIKYARKRYKNNKNKKFLKADILNSPKIYNRKFDAVMLISTIHHFSDEDLKIFLPKVKKITKKVIIIADIIPNPPHLLQRFFAKIDRGRYVRMAEEKLAIIKKNFTVKKIQMIPTRSAVQMGIVCEVKK